MMIGSSKLPPVPPIAVGRTAEVYAWGEDQVLKLFYDWCPSHWVAEEMSTSRAVTAMGLPTPGCLGAMEIDGRQGILYERVEGASMLKIASEKPWRITRLARHLAELHSQVHARDGAGFPSLHSSLQATIQKVDNLSPALKAQVLQRLSELPEGRALCHLDFHPDQVLITGKGPVILDWITARQGDPLADVARTSVMLVFSPVLNASRAMSVLIRLWRSRFYQAYLERYLELNPGASHAAIRAWMVPIAAARLIEQIPGEAEALQRFIAGQLPSA